MTDIDKLRVYYEQELNALRAENERLTFELQVETETTNRVIERNEELLADLARKDAALRKAHDWMIAALAALAALEEKK